MDLVVACIEIKPHLQTMDVFCFSIIYPFQGVDPRFNLLPDRGDVPGICQWR